MAKLYTTGNVYIDTNDRVRENYGKRNLNENEIELSWQIGNGRIYYFSSLKEDFERIGRKLTNILDCFENRNNSSTLLKYEVRAKYGIIESGIYCGNKIQ